MPTPTTVRRSPARRRVPSEFVRAWHLEVREVFTCTARLRATLRALRQRPAASLADDEMLAVSAAAGELRILFAELVREAAAAEDAIGAAWKKAPIAEAGDDRGVSG